MHISYLNCVHFGSILRINQTGRAHLVCHEALSEHTSLCTKALFLPPWRDDGRQSLCNTLILLPASKLYENPGSQKSGVCFSKQRHAILSKQKRTMLRFFELHCNSIFPKNVPRAPVICASDCCKPSTSLSGIWASCDTPQCWILTYESINHIPSIAICCNRLSAKTLDDWWDKDPATSFPNPMKSKEPKKMRLVPYL